MNACTHEDCENPTDLYLCNQCIKDLQAWIDKVPELIHYLQAVIYRQTQTRAPNNEGGTGGGEPDLSPINIDAYQLRENLLSIHPNATTYAHDQHGAGAMWMIQQWVTKADRLINGPEPERIDHTAIRQRIEKQAPPMPTRQLIPWLREHTKLAITSMDIRNWARRGKLQPAQREPQPTYWPHEVLKAHRETQERKF